MALTDALSAAASSPAPSGASAAGAAAPAASAVRLSSGAATIVARPRPFICAVWKSRNFCVAGLTFSTSSEPASGYSRNTRSARSTPSAVAKSAKPKRFCAPVSGSVKRFQLRASPRRRVRRGRGASFAAATRVCAYGVKRAARAAPAQLAALLQHSAHELVVHQRRNLAHVHRGAWRWCAHHHGRQHPGRAWRARPRHAHRPGRHAWRRHARRRHARRQARRGCKACVA